MAQGARYQSLCIIRMDLSNRGKEDSTAKHYRVLVTGFGANKHHVNKDSNPAGEIAAIIPSLLAADDTLNVSGVDIQFLGKAEGVKDEWIMIEATYADMRSAFKDIYEQYGDQMDLSIHLGRMGNQLNDNRTAHDIGPNPWAAKNVPLGLDADFDVCRVVADADKAFKEHFRSKHAGDSGPVVPYIRSHVDAGDVGCGFAFYEMLANYWVAGKQAHALFCHVPPPVDRASVETGRDAILAIIGACIANIIAEGKKPPRSSVPTARHVEITQSPQVYRLTPSTLFDELTEDEKLYAHHLSKAAWSGTRIILQQTSPEANDIFDLIIALYIACDGNWQALQKLTGISRDEISADADDMPEDVVKDQGELVNIEDVVEDSNPGPSNPDNTPSKRKADPTPGASKVKRTKTSKPVAKASSRPVTKAIPQKVKASGKQSSKIKSDEMVYNSEEDDVLKAINMIKSKSIVPKPSRSSISSTNSTGTTNTATVKAIPAKNSASPAPVKKVKKTLSANIDTAPLVANDKIAL
ncbi:MAG: hypothetical protein GOMPHAMPRED_000715 [Gomphillus americanus]|uniref:Uncharacterized protein n=1 Tax=Gomphillus americanus TaxID=1940652 RepID=A0A8H3IEB3_9LECA|nr:MAG: hypothetical protein GOMPHAMPRED_000715 [Gomphillus americanus]